MQSLLISIRWHNNRVIIQQTVISLKLSPFIINHEWSFWRWIKTFSATTVILWRGHVTLTLGVLHFGVLWHSEKRLVRHYITQKLHYLPDFVRLLDYSPDPWHCFWTGHIHLLTYPAGLPDIFCHILPGKRHYNTLIVHFILVPNFARINIFNDVSSKLVALKCKLGINMINKKVIIIYILHNKIYEL